MNKHLMSFFALSLFSSIAHSDSSTDAPNHFKLIAPLHLASCLIPVAEMKITKPEDITFFEKMTKIAPPTFRHPLFSEREQLSKIYDFFTRTNVHFSGSETLNALACKDLELLAGNYKPEITIFSTVDRTLLPEGKAFLAGLLTAPVADQEILKNRQAIISFFVENEQFSDALTTSFSEIKNSHHAFLSLWNEEKKGEQMFLDGAFYTLPGFRYLNSNTSYQHFSSALNCLIMPALYLAIDAKLIKFGYQYNQELKGTLTALNKDYPIATKLYALYGSACLVFMNYIIYDTVKKHIQLLNYLHEKANGAASLIRAIDLAEKIVSKSPELDHLQHKQALTDFAKLRPALSGTMKTLIQLLRTNTFKGSVSTLSLKGRVKVAYSLLKEVKDEFTPALLALAELDAYLSCAKLYKEYQNKENGFVFATYVTQDTPTISMEGMWNPFIGADKSILNSIELGTDALPFNVILTGPNAGGKSTFIKGLTLSILFAQTIGMVPAQSFTLTPFTKINTYMNIADDTSGGNSLFKAEVLRAQELIKSIDQLKAHEFAFSAMDEVFSGTSPKEGEAASYAVAHELGSRKNSILVLATHFPKLKDLETATKNFKNYQVRVIRHENGTFSYPFKLETGAADQNVAIEILQQQGFSSSILDKANQLLK